MLDDLLTDQDLSLSQQDPRLKPKEQKGTLVSVVQGLAGGTGKGLALPAAALLRPVVGGEKTDQVINSFDEMFKADNLSPAGEFTYSTATMLSSYAGTSLITLGAGGPFATAGAFGVVSASEEKSKLVGMGVSDAEAWRAGTVKGLTDTASTAFPVGGIVRNKIADAIVSVGGATLVGSGGQYIEGALLEESKNKKAKSYGEQLKDDAFSGTNLIANSAFGGLLWGLNARSKVRTEAQGNFVSDVESASQVDVNIEVAEKSNPLNPVTPKDTASHFDKLDAALVAAQNDQPFTNNKIEVTGQPKTKPVQLGSIPSNIVSRAKSEFGFSDDQIPFLLASVDLESGFNPKAFNNSSKAEGLFQVVPSTWQYRKGGDIKNTDEQIRVGLKNMKSDIDSVEKKLGRKLVGSEIYLPQLLGAGGARTLLRADPNEDFFSVAVRMYSNNKNPQAVARKMMKDNGIRKGMTAAEVKNKFLSNIEARSTKFGGDIDYVRASESGSLRGSESNFPAYEAQDVQVPEYKNGTELEYSVMPSVVHNNSDPFTMEMYANDFKAMEQPLTKEDLAVIEQTMAYKPAVGETTRTAYVEPTVDMSGAEINTRTLGELDELSVRQQQTNVESSPAIKQADQNAVDLNSEPVDLSDWNATRSDNYMKRESFNNDIRTQELYNKSTGTMFSRTIDKEGKSSPVAITKGNQQSNKIDTGSPEQTELQAKATQAIEAEFKKPEEAQSIQSFESTPDGREASKLIESNPDMDVTFTPVTIDGLELEPVTMKASELKQYIDDQYQDVASDIEAVRAAASCAIQFGV